MISRLAKNLRNGLFQELNEMLYQDAMIDFPLVDVKYELTLGNHPLNHEIITLLP